MSSSATPAARPRVLMLVHSFGKLTGVELHVHTLTQALRDRFEFGIAYPVQDQVHFLDAENGKTVLPGASMPWPETPLSQPMLTAAFDLIVAHFRPDLIHIQHFLNWPLDVLEHATNQNVPVVVSLHDYYAITPQHTFQDAAEPEETFGAAFCQKAFGRDLSAYLQERRRHIERGLSRANACIAVSSFLKDRLARIYDLPFRVVEYGIEGFEPHLRQPRAGGLRFGYFGNLVRHKGWHTLVQAFGDIRRIHTSAELHVFGWFDKQPPAQPGVTFHGTYQPGDVPRLAAQVDVAVIPSEYPETYSLVLSEMWQAGLPVLVSNIGALGDRVQEGIDGKKFRPGDVADLAKSLGWFIEHDDWRSWIIPRPRLVDAMAADYDSLYRELLAAGVSERSTALEADFLIVQICEFQEDGDGFYRLHEPNRQLARLPGVVTIDCDVHHRLLPRLAEQADILVLLGFDPDLVPVIEQRRAAGRATVFEANDFYDDVQPWNPLTEKWFDRSVQDGFINCMKLCDGIQTSTPELARRWRERTDRPIAVFQNQLAEAPELKPIPNRPLTIGWGGSPGHFADWLHAAGTLEPWLERHPDVHLAVMSNEFSKPFFQLPESRYHFTNFGSLHEYLRFLNSLDIGVAPLLPTDYNRCRSDVKYLEYASHGVVGIYADLECYRDSVKHGVTGFLYRTPEELVTYLDLLANDRPLREKIRQQAYVEVTATRRFEQHIGERLTFYQSLLPRGTNRRTIDPVIVKTAERHDRYLQLRRGEPEQMLAQATRGPTTGDGVESMQRLVQAEPDYVQAKQLLGRLFNDQNEPKRALQVLEEATQSQPRSTRTLCEIGRAHFLTNDHYRARQMLEFALTANPYYATGWFYLFRLMQLTSAPDAPRWLEQARKHHPRSYNLALLGARLLPDDKILAYMRALLNELGPGLTAHEKPAAGAAFAHALMQLAARIPAGPAVLEVLEDACRVFPQSAKLADSYARQLLLAGRNAEGYQELARALELRLTAKAYQMEYPKEDGSVYWWQFGEQILKLN